MQRRLVRHHLPIVLATAAALLVTYALTKSPNPVFRWSMATAYVGMALLGATLFTGPLNLLRRRPNPVSTDVRRDLGIWAGILAVAHFLIGWQVHMKHRYLYWLREAEPGGRLVPRTDLFGFANYTGLAAVLIACLLLALSNDRALRAMGTSRWKRFQRWSYALVVLVVVHGVGSQVIENRKAGFVATLAVLSIGIAVVQYLGYRRRRSAGRGTTEQLREHEAA